MLRLALPGVCTLLVLLLLVPAASAGLTAGDVDDNLNWDPYLAFVGRMTAADPDLPGLGLEGRVTLRLLDPASQPLAFLPVVVEDTVGGSVRLVSGGDGLVHVFPILDRLSPEGGLFVSIAGEGQGQTDGAVTVPASAAPGLPSTITLPVKAVQPGAIDLMLVIDTTGSMSDELHYLTTELASIVADVKAQHPNADLRLGLTVYRDTGDVYVVRSFGFTDSVAEMQARLAGQRAGGGGDKPEAMDAALAEAMLQEWRPGPVARLLFLVADAPPHEAGYGPFLAAAAVARARGIHIEPVGASGVDDAAEYLLRAAAVMTQGRYMFLTDDSGLGNSHAEPHVQCYLVTELSGLIVRIVASEFTGQRIEPRNDEILRRSGSYDRGVCLDGEDGQAQPDPAMPVLEKEGTGAAMSRTPTYPSMVDDRLVEPGPATDPVAGASDVDGVAMTSFSLPGEGERMRDDSGELITALATGPPPDSLVFSETKAGAGKEPPEAGRDVAASAAAPQSAASSNGYRAAVEDSIGLALLALVGLLAVWRRIR